MTPTSLPAHLSECTEDDGIIGTCAPGCPWFTALQTRERDAVIARITALLGTLTRHQLREAEMAVNQVAAGAR